MNRLLLIAITLSSVLLSGCGNIGEWTWDNDGVESEHRFLKKSEKLSRTKKRNLIKFVRSTLDAGTSLCIDAVPYGIPIEVVEEPVKVDIVEQASVSTQVNQVEDVVEVLELPVEDVPGGVTEEYVPSMLESTGKSRRRRRRKNKAETQETEESEEDKLQEAIKSLRDNLNHGTSLCIKAEVAAPTDDEDTTTGDEDEASSEPIEASYFNAFKVNVDGKGPSATFKFDRNEVHDIIAKIPLESSWQNLFNGADELTGMVGYGVVLQNLRSGAFLDAYLQVSYSASTESPTSTIGCSIQSKDDPTSCDMDAKDWKDDDWVVLTSVCTYYKTSTEAAPEPWSCVDARP